MACCDVSCVIGNNIAKTKKKKERIKQWKYFQIAVWFSASIPYFFLKRASVLYIGDKISFVPEDRASRNNLFTFPVDEMGMVMLLNAYS